MSAADPIDGSDIADPTQVVDAHMRTFTGKDHLMENGGQWRSLAAGGDIRRSEIADHGDPQAFRQIRRLA